MLYSLIGIKVVSYAREFETEVENSLQGKTNRYIKFVYDKIKFNKVNKLSFDAFKYGFYGYLNMVESGKISPYSLLTICDFTLSSNIKRMWVIDIKNKKVLFNTLVAHGMGTGEEFATAFSNTEDSHQSSLGFYTTGETYDGNNGYSLKLNGVDGMFNSNAYERAIVIHGAEYVSEDFAKANKRIGRSHGCPALPVDVAPKVIDKIKNGTCFFIYHSTKNYLASSYWLRNKIKQLPQEAENAELLANAFNNPRFIEPKHNENEVSSSADKNDVNTCEIKKQDIILKERPDHVTSIMVINENSRAGTSDTTIVK